MKIDFSDEVDEREKEGGKKKKAVAQKAKVKVPITHICRYSVC